MCQVLFYIPGTEIPIYGYGMMLFVAFVFCTWLASHLARREGIEPKHVQDMAIWVFVLGILGARIVYTIQYWNRFNRADALEAVKEFFRVWQGGLVLYGAFIGGAIGYVFAYIFILRKHKVPTWKMADVIAPAIALGVCIGRVGCLLNGCCYGNVACAHCPAISFPLSSPPRIDFVERGYQTAAGFTLDPEHVRTVGAVEPDSPAARAGLRAGDIILKVNGSDVEQNSDIAAYLTREWKRGKNDLSLKVRHPDRSEDELSPFSHGTLGLHPTQVYESISMALLFAVLLAYYPLRKRDGAIMVVLMFGYAVHRFLNEMLRTDTEPVAFGMTLSQNVSILLFIAAVVLTCWIRSRPPRESQASQVPQPVPS